MKYLVTGAAGFLGSHLTAALLARGDEVVAFDRRLRGKCLGEGELARVQLAEADIFDLGMVTRATEGCAAIFHCAAIVGVDAYTSQPARTMETEETGLRNVCRAALANGEAKVIYASSSAVYGNASGVLREDTDRAKPESNYGAAKYFNEFFLAAQFLETGLRSVSLRIFNVYGPRQDERLVIPRFIRSAMAGEPIVVFGDGAQTRDFVYVDDVVAAALACADSVEGNAEVVNVSSGRETAIATLAETIISLTDSQSVLVRREPPAGRSVFEVARCVGSREKLERLTDASPATPLEQGLRETIGAWSARNAGGVS